ncbi:hypothetical protein [Spirosoma validum]|uniref:Uncharacterized protein n=1 Tax=Spirosoma validum TaxID=2771355 RepID=A0A927B774_9BACT|nr:hypothetical protein [Spirosoma validum]MBD2756994.1 hypothetical protein [Spirosoma validum]
MNDTPVADEEELYRSIYRTPWHKYVDPDGRPTSRNFKLRPKDGGKLSVDVASLTTPEQSVRDLSKFALASLTNVDVKAIGLSTYYDPCTVEEHGFDNPAHAYIWGMDDDDDIKPALLAQKAVVILK